MNQLIALCATIRTQWLNLVSSRAGEVAILDAATGQPNSFTYYSAALERWHAQLSAFSKLPKRRVSGTTQSQNSLTHTFGAIKYALDSTGNGVQWIIDNRSFNMLLPLAESQIDTLERELQKDRSLQVEAAKTQLANYLEVIELGAEKAQQLSIKTDEVVEAAQLATLAIGAANVKKIDKPKMLQSPHQY